MQLRKEFENSQHCLMKCGRAKWQEAEATRKDFNIVLIYQDKKFFITELFKVILDAIPLILHYRTKSGQFLRVHLSHRMRNQFTLHHKFRIDTGRTKLRQGKTDSILYCCESHEQGTQRSKPRLAWYKHKTWKRHQDTVYWVDIQLAQQKGLKF